MNCRRIEVVFLLLVDALILVSAIVQLATTDRSMFVWVRCGFLFLFAVALFASESSRKEPLKYFGGLFYYLGKGLLYLIIGAFSLGPGLHGLAFPAVFWTFGAFSIAGGILCSRLPLRCHRVAFFHPGLAAPLAGAANPQATLSFHAQTVYVPKPQQNQELPSSTE
jgi:hypothetical protein